MVPEDDDALEDGDNGPAAAGDNREHDREDGGCYLVDVEIV